jgi:hypothetical protein
MTTTPRRTDSSREEMKTPARESKWVILVYQAADNNLSEECVYALTEMKKIVNKDSNGKKTKDREIEVIVQLDPAGRGNPTRRFRINKPGGDDTLENDVFWEETEIDTGSPRALREFLIASIKAFPAEHYMVVLTGHGAGIFEGFFLQDETTPLSTLPSSFPIKRLNDVFGHKDLKKILKSKNRKIDILGFDACMMSMLEVCFQIRESEILDLVVGSEGFTLNSGWPYREILTRLTADPRISPLRFAHTIADEYVRFYQEYFLGGLSVDISVMKLSDVDELKSEVDALAGALIKTFGKAPRAEEVETPGSKVIDDGGYDDTGGHPFQDALILAHWAAQSYNGERCVDLFDFCDLLRKRLCKLNRKECYEEDCDAVRRRDSVAACCQRVMCAIEKTRSPLVLKSCYAGAAFQYSHGVSIYFPWAEFDLDPSYQFLDFGHSEWAKFLGEYLRATKRKARPSASNELRATPPGNKGTDGKIFSMRNPPNAFKKRDCLTNVKA